MDNGSVFTKNIIEFLSSIRINHVVLPFDKVNLSDVEKFHSFILSGRRQNNQAMNVLNSKIINHTISEKKSLLGICYGAEILALTVGGTIRKISTIQKGENTVEITGENPLCGGVIQTYQSHSFEISQLGKSLIPLGRSDSCKYEMVQYLNTKIFGTQFHPEMTNDGLSIIEKFVKL